MRGSQAASPGTNTLLVRSKEIGVASLNSKPAPRPQLLKRLRWRRSQQLIYAFSFALCLLLSRAIYLRICANVPKQFHWRPSC